MACQKIHRFCPLVHRVAAKLWRVIRPPRGGGNAECSMTEESESAGPNGEPPPWLQATAVDFLAVDLNEPIARSASVDAREISTAFSEVVKGLEESQRAAEQRVYAMLGAVCSFHFRPSNRDEPFGPMAQFGDRRTAVPGDFKGAPAAILAGSLGRIENPSVRARVADMVWLLDRKQAPAGWQAIESYTEIVRSVRDGRKSFRAETGVHGYEIANHLRRGIQIARVLGWDKEKAKALRSLVSELRAEAAQEKNARSFPRLATLDLDYRITEASTIAAEAEEISDATSDLHVKHDLLHVAGRAYRVGKDQVGAERNLLRAAECLVGISENHSGSGMFEAHWLERAISEMHHVSGTKEQRRALKHKLVDAQARIIDEMTSFSHTDDISEVVEASRAAAAGKSLPEALRAFSSLSRAPSSVELEAEAQKVISENPLSSIFAATQYDAQGKPVHRDQGLESGDDRAVVERQIGQSEKIRRSLVVQGGIEPTRLAIAEEHYVDQDVIGIICSQSPFVPQDRRAIFTSGLVDFFHGNMIAALHTLNPQLENSLRHVLRLHGHDVTKLNDDMTQEDLGFSVLLDKLRPGLNDIFGERMVTDIDSVFNYRGGPNLRNRVAHGLVAQWEPHSDDAIYACWLILQLCCIPLLPHWEQLAGLIDHAQDPRQRRGDQ